MRFTKMHGIGNDYIYVNAFRQEVRDPAALAPRIADRHFGVGGDGLILIRPPSSPEGDCRMEMYNADGSRGAMCGNGIRCVAKYVHDEGLCPRDAIRIETDAGVKTVRVERGPDGLAASLEVDMGRPILERGAIPMTSRASSGVAEASLPMILEPLELRGRIYRATAVSMGNPHLVVRWDDPENNPDGIPLEDVDLAALGPLFERHESFPDRTNTELIAVASRTRLVMRVWERGSGETLACGTGACAAAVAAVLAGWCEPALEVQLRGGSLSIRWERAIDASAAREGARAGSVFLRGPAARVFEGEWLGSS